MDLEPSRRYGNWTGAEIETFLRDTRIPLRLSLVSKAGSLIVPVWFEYRGACFCACSPNDSLLVKALRENSEVAFDVSTNELPYQGVRGRGIARCTVASGKAELERLLDRYLGATDSVLAHWLLNRNGSEAVIEVEISWLTSWDFSGRMEGIEKISKRFPDAAL